MTIFDRHKIKANEIKHNLVYCISEQQIIKLVNLNKFYGKMEELTIQDIFLLLREDYKSLNDILKQFNIRHSKKQQVKCCCSNINPIFQQ